MNRTVRFEGRKKEGLEGEKPGMGRGSATSTLRDEGEEKMRLTSAVSNVTTLEAT